MLTVSPVNDLAFFLGDGNERVLPFSQTSVNYNTQESKFRTCCSWKNLTSCRCCNLKQHVTNDEALDKGMPAECFLDSC